MMKKHLIHIDQNTILHIDNKVYKNLTRFEYQVIQGLRDSAVVQVDETDITLGKKLYWLHCMSNGHWTLYYPHEKKGTEAFYEVGLRPGSKGVLAHDRWKPYFKKGDKNALCNAFILNELNRVWTTEGFRWTIKMRAFLRTLKAEVEKAGGILNSRQRNYYHVQYRKLLKIGQIQCLTPALLLKNKGTPVVQTESADLLERLKECEDHVLMFMKNKHVAFSYKDGQGRIPLPKALQLKAECSDSYELAIIYCRIHSYLTTCNNRDITSDRALYLLVKGELPDFYPLQVNV